MNFIEAIKLIRAGKRVRRKEWLSYAFIFWSPDCLFYCDLSTPYNPIFSDYEATDWEIVDEDKDWNLADVLKINCKNYDCMIEANKKCRDLIYSDISCCHNLSEALVKVNKRFGDL